MGVRSLATLPVFDALRPLRAVAKSDLRFFVGGGGVSDSILPLSAVVSSTSISSSGCEETRGRLEAVVGADFLLLVEGLFVEFLSPRSSLEGVGDDLRGMGVDEALDFRPPFEVLDFALACLSFFF